MSDNFTKYLIAHRCDRSNHTTFVLFKIQEASGCYTIIPGLDGSVSRSCVCAGVGCINTRAGHELSRSLESHNHRKGPYKDLVCPSLMIYDLCI